MNFTSKYVLLIISFFCFSSYSQVNLNGSLYDKANAVILEEDITVTIEKANRYIYKKHLVIQVLNAKGFRNANIEQFYDESIGIDKLEAIIFDNAGNLLKKVKKRDFVDVSATGSSIYSDSRLKYLKFTPTKYPFTIDFSVETTNANTAFLPSWNPVKNYNVGVAKSSFQLINETNDDVKFKEENLDEFNVNHPKLYKYEVEGIKPVSYEPLSSRFNNLPNVKFSLENFNLLGKEGTSKDWLSLGNWMYSSLINFETQISDQTKLEVIDLVKDLPSDIEKAKKIYEYVQNKTRYVSVQIGVGGWRPMHVKDVDVLGYGDCKGLTNYMRALLKLVDIESYYTILYAGHSIKDIDEEFPSLQGNHAMLAIPINNSKYAWLECTSQSAPFNYNGTSSDNRKVLVVEPNGTKIVATNKTVGVINVLAEVNILNDTTAEGVFEVVNKGWLYSYVTSLSQKSKKEIDLYYKNKYNELAVNKYKLENNKDSILFKQKLNFKSKKMCSKLGNEFLLQPNVFNDKVTLPSYIDNKNNSFTIKRDEQELTEVIVNLPENLLVSYMPEEAIVLSTDFGEYHLECKLNNTKQLVVKRKLFLKAGEYSNTQYESYFSFIKQILKKDNLKILLKKNEG